jgi:hypothetical protein
VFEEWGLRRKRDRHGAGRTQHHKG